MSLKEKGLGVVKRVMRLFPRGSGKSIAFQRPLLVEMPGKGFEVNEFSYNRQVTYRKKKSQAKRKAWKKYSL